LPKKSIPGAKNSLKREPSFFLVLSAFYLDELAYNLIVLFEFGCKKEIKFKKISTVPTTTVSRGLYLVSRENGPYQISGGKISYLAAGEEKLSNFFLFLLLPYINLFQLSTATTLVKLACHATFDG
jgi:hypothetical protein